MSLQKDKLPDGYKKYLELISSMSNEFLIERLHKKAEQLKNAEDLTTIDKIHHEIMLLVMELKERELI